LTKPKTARQKNAALRKKLDKLILRDGTPQAVEAKIKLFRNEQGYWLQVESPSGASGAVNINNSFRGIVRKVFLEWAKLSFLDAEEPKPQIGEQKTQIH